MSKSLLHAFKGADSYFAESKHISVEAAEEDQIEEEESLLNSFDVDDREAAGTLRFSATNTVGGEDNMKKKKPKHSNNQLASSLQAASEGVVVGTTLSDYQRYGMGPAKTSHLMRCMISLDTGISLKSFVSPLTKHKLQARLTIFFRTFQLNFQHGSRYGSWISECIKCCVYFVLSYGIKMRRK